MKVSYALNRKVEGELDEVLAAKLPEKMLTMGDVTQSLNDLAFIVETVAHLQGKEAAMLPHADKARAIIKELKGE
jgi:hypothetical protein